MYRLEIVDTHIHIWDFAKANYPWLEGNTSILNQTYSIYQLEPERLKAGVTKGILVQAANNDRDTDWMLQVAADTNWISGVIGWLPLMDPEKVERQLVVRKANSYFKGVRHLIHDEADPQWLIQPEVLESLALLAKSNLTYDVVGVLPTHLEAAIKVAEKIPDLKIMLDHLNQPPHTNTAGCHQWCDLIKVAAGLPNVYAKISGLGTAMNEADWSAVNIEPAINFALENFGAERCCLGGDWPVSLLAGNYEYTWQQYKLALTTLNGPNSLENVFFTTAKQFYNL